MSQHLSDDRLIEMCFAADVPPGDESHVGACPDCQLRHRSLARMLSEVNTSAAIEADAAFPDDRLARQQARILQRIDQAGRPGRVIAFPAAQAGSPSLLRSRPATRWAAVAAAAAFVVGLLTGHLAHDLPAGTAIGAAPRMVANESRSDAPLRAVSTTLSDDELLGQVEMAVVSSGPAALRALDVMTPRAWDVR
jgi:hypothetical protein